MEDYLIPSIKVKPIKKNNYPFPMYLTEGKEYLIFKTYNGTNNRGNGPSFHIINDLGIETRCLFNWLGQFWEIVKDEKYKNIINRRNQIKNGAIIIG